MLPHVPGLEVAAYYHIASADEVGGDFYDLFPLDRQPLGRSSWATCAARAPPAAAVTSLARYTLRAAAVYDPDPVAVLTNLNTVLNHEYNGDDPRYCTVDLRPARPRRRPGRLHVVLASGGHPPALMLRADGTADYLPTPGGQLIGVLPDAHSRHRHRPPGARRHPAPLHRRPDRSPHRRGQARTATATTPCSPSSVTWPPARPRTRSARSASCSARSATGVDDDTAVLAVHVPRAGSEERQ